MDIEKYMACHECDLLHFRHSLAEGEAAYCRRCGAKLFSEKVDMVDRGLALNIAALIFYMIAISLPFLGLETDQFETTISLFQSVSALYNEGMKLLSVLVCIVLLIAPGVRILGMLFLLIPLKLYNEPVKSPWIYRVIEWVAPWNMIEIYLIGILVTFVKLGDMAQIVLGISFWAFIALVLTTVVSNTAVNRHCLWDKLEGAP